MPEPAPIERARVVYRWDLDKTYLRTDFDTVRDLVRTAFEPPARKRTVPGAGALLRELRQTGPAAVFILSGSPEQMRRVLEAKLRLDGIRWDAFTLKPSLENLLRGRLRFLRDQVSYKLTALLESRTRAAPDTLPRSAAATKNCNCLSVNATRHPPACIRLRKPVRVNAYSGGGPCFLPPFVKSA